MTNVWLGARYGLLADVCRLIAPFLLTRRVTRAVSGNETFTAIKIKSNHVTNRYLNFIGTSMIEIEQRGLTK